MTVINESPTDVEIRYSVGGTAEKQEFPSGSAGGFDVKVEGSASPRAIKFQAFEKGTSNALALNDQAVLEVVPTEIKKEVLVKVKGGSK